MKNNNPIDALMFAEASNRVRFGAAKVIWGSAATLLILIVGAFAVQTEFFNHYFIHAPIMVANGNWKRIATLDHTYDGCSRCRTAKQTAISMLTPEERQMIKTIDQANVIRAKGDAAANAAYQRELKNYLEIKDNEKWYNYLNEEYNKAVEVLNNNK